MMNKSIIEFLISTGGGNAAGREERRVATTSPPFAATKMAAPMKPRAQLRHPQRYQIFARVGAENHPAGLKPRGREACNPDSLRRGRLPGRLPGQSPGFQANRYSAHEYPVPDPVFDRVTLRDGRLPASARRALTLTPDAHGNNPFGKRPATRPDFRGLRLH